MKEFFIAEDLLGTHFLSPDGRWALAIAPEETVRLYDTSQNITYRVLEVTKTEFGHVVRGPLEVVAEGASFNQPDGNGETTQCALLTDGGTSVTIIDLLPRYVRQPFAINLALGLSEDDDFSCTTIAYGPAGNIFLGTSTGEIILLTLDVFDELGLTKTIKVSNSAVVLLAPQFLVEGSVSVYTDDGELISVHVLSEEIVLIDRGDQSWLIEAMRFHPELEAFAMWRGNGDILISSSTFGSIQFNFSPYDYQGDISEHFLTAVLIVSEQLILVVTRKEVLALQISYDTDDIEAEETSDNQQSDVSASDQQPPTIRFQILYEARSGFRILSAVLPTPDTRDLVVLTTF